MKKHQKSARRATAVLAAIMAGCVCTAHAGPYSNGYFFGDSLTDAGVFTPIVGPNNLFTTNPGTVWAQNLGTRYGWSVTPAYSAYNPAPYGFSQVPGGNDFAVGMGRIALAPTSADAVNIPPVTTQVSDFFNRGVLDPNALYAVSGGHNDVIAQVNAFIAGAAPADVQAAIATAANDLVGQVTRLQAAGVRNLIVVGIMDISRTPYAQTLTPAQLSELQTLVSTFNSTLATGLAGKNVLYFDTSRLLNTILANPAAYGFTNTTTPACSPAALGCSPVGTQGYLFADPKHPSAAAHLVISDWIYSSLEAANRIGLLSQVAMARTEAQWRSIDARLQEFENFGYHGQGVFFSADYASQKYGSGALSSDDSGSNFVLGFEKALNDHLYGGVTVAHGHAPFDLGNNQGSVSYDEWSLSAFAAYKVGSFYANALASYARLDFASTRSIALGSTFHTLETGDTGGNRYAFKGQLGYNFVNGGIVHGPLAGLAWAHVDIDGFDENSSSITAMSFGDQTRESLRSRLGWQAAAETLWFGARVRPYAQLTYDYQYLKDDRSYRVGFVGGTSGLDIATANLTGGYGTVLAGLNAELSKTLRLSVVASTTIGQPGESVTAATVTLSAPF